MRSTLAALAVCAALVFAARSGAQEPAVAESSARLFPLEAEIVADAAPALVRLPLPSDVLAACRSDLSDLRVFDLAGRELPFVVDAGARSDLGVERRSRGAEVKAVDRSLEAPEDGTPSVREVYEIVPKKAIEPRVLAVPPASEAPPEPPLAWSLRMRSSRPEFVRHVRVSQRLADGSLEPLVEHAPLFRLDDTKRDRVALGALPDALVVEITGREDFYLEPRFSFVGESGEQAVEATRLEVPLAAVADAPDGTRTVLGLARPPGLVPDALRISTTTGAFSRRVTAYDLRHGEPERALGTRRLFRAPLDPTIEELELPVAASAGDRLRLEIEDGSLPPLESLEVSALLRQPSLLFFAPAASAAGGPVALLRFGGGRAERARYGVADLWPGAGGASTDRFAARRAAAARLGEPRPNPLHDAAPALAFAQQPGAVVDPRLWARRREVSVPPAPDGLVRLRLALEDVAAARDDLADLRVVDADDRQWPYLLEAEAARSWQAVAVEAPTSKGGWSRYRLALPAAPARLDGLEVLPDTGFVQRRFRLLASGDGAGEHELAQGAWRSRAERAATLDVAFAPARVEGLVLEVEDGDEAPLALRAVRVRVVLPELYLVAPEGEYALLVGQPDAAAPSYALAGVRDVVLAVSATPAEAGPLGGNPVFERSARLAGDLASGLGRRLAVWLALAAAVAVLVVVTLRLVRRESETDSMRRNGDA